jgi:hypothetical protein
MPTIRAGNVRSRAILILSVLSLIACVEASAPLSPGAQENPTRSAPFLATALDHFARGAEGPLRFDPRPLRPDADPGGIRAESVDAGDGAASRFRTRVARERGIALTDAVRDKRCAFVHGLGVPEHILRTLPDSVLRRREDCLRRGFFTTVILGVPEPVRNEEAQLHPGAWKIRAFRMTTSSFESWDLYLGSQGGGWTVLGTKRIFGIQS